LALSSYNIDIKDKRVLDFGCGDGAITPCYADIGAAEVIGADIDGNVIKRAIDMRGTERIKFVKSTRVEIPIQDQSIDVIVAVDVFEHVSNPREIVKEFYRILAIGGRAIIRTLGWRHPFAHHRWSVMPVPWSHIVFPERQFMHACKRVYLAKWYKLTLYDVDEQGRKILNKYDAEKRNRDFLNQFLIRDFETILRESPFKYDLHLFPFSSKYASWTKPLLHNRLLREYFTSYFIAVLKK
jgi:SAM-dependent methyltransferase